MIFPVEQWDAGVEGETVLRVRVNATGTVDSVEVMTGSGTAALDSAAVRGMRALRFRPATREGDPVAAWVEVPVRFRRSEESNEEGVRR